MLCGSLRSVIVGPVRSVAGGRLAAWDTAVVIAEVA